MRLETSHFTLHRPETFDPLPELERVVEDRSNRDHAEQVMPGDGGEAGRRNTPAIAAVGRAAELTGCDAGGQVGRDHSCRPGEHAFIWRIRRVRVHIDEPFRQCELRIADAQLEQVGDGGVFCKRGCPYPCAIATPSR